MAVSVEARENGRDGTILPRADPAADPILLIGELAGLDKTHRTALRSALSRSVLERVDDVRPSTHHRARWQAKLARLLKGPDFIVTEGFPLAALAAGLYRCVAKRVVFRVFLTEPPDRLGWLERLILHLADGVLVDGDAVARVVSAAGFPARSVCRLTPRHELGAFLRLEPARLPGESRRIVVASDLDPASGVADLLAAVMTWSERHPDQAVELCWIGEGDLATVLSAQPLPANTSQTFAGPLRTEAVAAVFARSEFLVVPAMQDDRHAPVAEALAACLPVVGSRQSQEVRQLVTEGVNGWLFDPLHPGDLLDTLTRALATPDHTLDATRARARASVTQAASGPIGRVHRTAL